MIASANGFESRNADCLTCEELAFRRITSGDDVLDALIAGVNLVELDPEDTSVGYGGLPDGDGVVTLDACCMHGPKRRAGGVAFPAGRAHAVPRRASSGGRHRSSPAGGSGRSGLRP